MVRVRRGLPPVDTARYSMSERSHMSPGGIQGPAVIVSDNVNDRNSASEARLLIIVLRSQTAI